MSNLLYHQGGWICSAAPAALPALVDLARGAANHRADVVEVIATIAAEAHVAEPEFVDPAWWAALDAARAGLLALLADPDPGVRRAAIVVVAKGIRHPEAVAALRARWLVEADRVTRWDLVVALGWSSAELAVLLADDDLHVRLAALYALAERAEAARRVDLLVRAALDPDAGLWRDSAWLGDAWRTAGALVEDDQVAAVAFTIGIGRGGADDQRVATVVRAGRVLADWRSAGESLLPLLVDHLDDGLPEVRYRATALLACLGREAERYADRVALEDDGRYRRVTVGDAAVWALARFGDARCVPGLVERLSGDRLGFSCSSVHFDRSVDMLGQPGIHEVLVPLRAYADDLVDAVAGRLTTCDDPALAVNLCSVVAAWGCAAALPAVVAAAADERVLPWAAKAIGALGAAESALELRDRADVPAVAWALCRTGADPELGVAVLLRGVAGGESLDLVADLGDAAAGAVGSLRALTRSGDEWLAVRAAGALWRVAGEVAPVLAEVVEPLGAGAYLPVRVTALRVLADAGERAERVRDVARAVLDNPRRLACSGGWRTFAEDEELRAIAGRLVG
ncbi:HEAT repeat domain-containing protein [Actinokineospora auranticolor]|uniref:HEAT repeat domain-containing protein n=1 Tax=Actinokineospora auranticolor TaxID=155976 RepID=UPI001FEBC7CE|nr:HEAT repeat domain-containing protein [Actinokineospora auranticolor]